MYDVQTFEEGVSLAAVGDISGVDVTTADIAAMAEDAADKAVILSVAFSCEVSNHLKQWQNTCWNQLSILVFYSKFKKIPLKNVFKILFLYNF